MTFETKDILGTSASPVTLTAAFSGNVSSVMMVKYYKKLSLDVVYTPVTTNAYAQLIVEYSQDSINTVSPSNWRPFAVAVPASTQVNIYAQKGDTMGTSSGTPIDIPTPNTSTAAQAVNAHIVPDTDLVCNFIRVRAQETGAGGSFGTLYVQAAVQE